MLRHPPTPVLENMQEGKQKSLSISLKRISILAPGANSTRQQQELMDTSQAASTYLTTSLRQTSPDWALTYALESLVATGDNEVCNASRICSSKGMHIHLARKKSC